MVNRSFLNHLTRAEDFSPRHIKLVVIVLCCLLTLSARAAENVDLEAGFHTPPHSAGIRCFWWWLNGNVTKEAITRDLEEMKAKGYSGALIFDADGSSQAGNQRVPAGPIFAGPEWTKLFVHACKEAARLDLELSLNIQSGWNLGGPKVSAEEATQHLIWSKTEIEGSAKIQRKLAVPGGINGFYNDIAVLAVPLPNTPDKSAEKISASATQSADHPLRNVLDGDPGTFWVSGAGPSPDSPQWLLLELSTPTEISKLGLQGRKGYGPRNFKIQLSTDGRKFNTVKELALKDGENGIAEFSKQKCRFVRLVFTNAYDAAPIDGKARNVQVAEIVLPGITATLRNCRPIKNLKLKNATRELGMSAADCRYLLNTSPARPGEMAVASKDIVNITDKMDSDGQLTWDAPAGKWVILRFGHTATGAHVSTCNPNWGGRVLDYMNPDSLRNYWERNIAPLIEAIDPLTGKAWRYVHTDSWEGGGMNWTPGFDRTFKKNRGYDPLPWLAVMAGYVVDSREDSNAFLSDFRKTIGDLVADHYGLLAELAQKHGMATHPECSGPHAGPLDGLKNYGRSELMMSEFWAPSPHRPTPPMRFFVKQASSAAHTYGKRLVGAEGFTTIGTHWNVVPWSMMKPSFDHEFCAGLNILFHHTFTCSPREMGMPGQEYFAGTHFNPQITWWDETPTFIDYLRRCQYLAQAGEFVADVLYYYGDHIPNIARLKADDPAGALPDFDYDVLSEELLLSSLTVSNGSLRLPSGMRYRVLVLPDHRVLSLGALEKVDKLVRAGATVLGPKPIRAVSLEAGSKGKRLFTKLADGLWGPDDPAPNSKGIRKVGPGRVAWGMPARDLLHSIGVASDLTLKRQDGSKPSGMDWIHYRINDADVYFLAQFIGQAQYIDATFRATGRIPELWNPVDGSIREAQKFQFVDGRTVLPLKLNPYDSIFVVFQKPTSKGRDAGPNFATWQPTQTIEGPWSVAFDSRRGGPAQPVRLKALTSWINQDDPAVKYYSGKAVYRATFNSALNPKEAQYAIELGQVEDLGIARVRLNSTDLGLTWRPPFRVDITEALKTGENILEVEVVNSWRNRLIGDRDLPGDKRLTRTNISTRGWRLQESGLLGPVRIMEQVNPE